MSLKYIDLFGEHDKVAQAIEKLKLFEPKKDGYYVAFSGGKDSQCVLELCKMSGVKYDAHYSITTVDPPQLVRFIKKQYPQVSMEMNHDADGNPVTMWNLIEKHNMPPTRKNRYCCAELKECNGKGRVTVTGVRWAESPRRKALHGVVDIGTKSKKIIQDALENVEGASLNDRGGLILNSDNDDARLLVQHCMQKRKVVVNPILDWEDEDVWEFLNDVAKVPHCELYDPPWNFKRIGCIGCPMAGKGMIREFELFPKYKENYIKAFDRMIRKWESEHGETFESEHFAGGGSCSSTGQNLQHSDGSTNDGLVAVDISRQQQPQNDPKYLTGEQLMCWMLYVYGSPIWDKYKSKGRYTDNIRNSVKEYKRTMSE